MAERGRAEIAARLRHAVEKQRLSQDDHDEAVARLAVTTDLGELASCPVVIEAAVERFDVKLALFEELATIVSADAVLATNTSTLSVTEIAAATPGPERVVGLHFFNPAPVLPLVEVVGTALSSEAALATATAFV